MSGKKTPPWGLSWRCNTNFIIATVAVGLFTDLFLYGLVIPVLPFMLRSRLAIPEEKIQSHTSVLLAVFAGASVLCSVPSGWVADRTNTRRTPYLFGLTALLAATVMLALGRTMPVLVLARVLQGMSGAIVWTVGFALVIDTVGSEHLGKVIGTIFSFISVGQLVAPVVGGILYEKTGYKSVFELAAALLTVDFIMRILVVERKVAARYEGAGSEDISEASDDNPRQDEEGADEGTSLLPKKDDELYTIPDGQHSIIKNLPILYCLSNPRVLVAFVLAFVQAALLASFDTTVTTESQSLFGFNSLKAGLLFIPLDIPYLLLGPIAGWAVDKYGTKPAAVLGFGYLVPMLILLGLPSWHVITDPKGNMILYCAMLALNGIGMAIISSPSIVEASEVVQKYHEANPGFFGNNGPYAQLYGFNSLIFSFGLTVGPIASGVMRDNIGYSYMNVVFAALSGVTALLSWIYIGGKPKMLQKV